MDVTRRIVAGWILEERLGSGGYGEVWKARRRHVNLFRALKLIPIASDGAFASWRHEIVRLEGLSHPNIVRFYDADVVADAGPYHDYAWIATELCERSLADELAHRPDRLLTSAEGAGLLEAMLGALAVAHESGCVHRDVKPANILLHASGVWKLCDFGTARLVPQGESYPLTGVVGTFPYMSAAAHRGRQDQAADLYALGVTVHESLCGLRLHPRPSGMTESEYVKLILDTPPVISPYLHRPWRDIVAALIGEHGSYSARELLTELRRVRGSVTSRPAIRPASPVTNGAHPRSRPPSPSRPTVPPRTTELDAVTPRRGEGPARSGPSTAPHSVQADATPASGRERRRERRAEQRERLGRRPHSGAASLVALAAVVLGSLGVAAGLLYTVVPDPLVIAGIVAAVLVVTVLLMTVF